MSRDELIQEVKKECHLEGCVNSLISEVITEGEEILGKFLDRRKVEAPEKRGITTMNYDYYIVTGRKFVRIFASDTECWYKVCLLDRFVGVEEKISIPASLEVNVDFDVTDNELRQIKFISERTEPSDRREIRQREIKKFVSALMTAVSVRDNR